MTAPYRRPWLRPLFLLWWRLRERDVTDAGELETKGPPDYKYGKVSGLDPKLSVITETTESPWTCCGYCSAAMAAWTARDGVPHSMSSGAHPIRSAGGRPHNNGSKASELRNGTKSAHGVTLDALAVSEIRDVLRDGFAVVVNLTYSGLPSWLRVTSGDFGHSCTLYGWREDGDYVGFYDPLWPEGAAGAWLPWSQLTPALWGDGEHSATMTTTREPEPEPEPEPDPCPDCPPAEKHDDAQLAAELAAAVADAVSRTTLERDRAWRGITLLEQPRIAAGWMGGPADGGHPVRWSWFARWEPSVLPLDSWNSGTTWGDTRWS